MTYKYRIADAALQLGHMPPYTLWSLDVRMNGDMPQILIKTWDHTKQELVETWHDWPKDEKKDPPITHHSGVPVAGITSTWDVIR